MDYGMDYVENFVLCIRNVLVNSLESVQFHFETGVDINEGVLASYFQ